MIIKTVISIIAYLILAPIVGGLLAGLDRKFSAKMQRRVGPPVLQPFYDVFKLFEKEDQTVTKVQDFYVLIFVVFVIVSGAIFFGGGDMLLVIFTLTLASAFLIIAAYSSNSPYAEIGAERELLQMMAYEPMVLMTVIGFYMCCGSFAVKDVLAGTSMPFLPMIGLFIGFLFILTIKFRKSPFDLSMSHHAHQEMVKGLTTEFNGKMFAIVEITHWYESIFLMGMLALFFLNNKWWSVILAFVFVAVCYFIEILVDNTNARLKWKTMFDNTWIVTAVLGAINLIVIEVLKGKGVI